MNKPQPSSSQTPAQSPARTTTTSPPVSAQTTTTTSATASQLSSSQPPAQTPPQQQQSTSQPAQTSSQSPIYHFKVLVPAAAAGRIIGKGGNAIVQLQKDAGARIKLSKASEFYPGTTERVCLISGPIEGILKIIESIVKSLTPDHLSRPNISSSPPNNNGSNGISNYNQMLSSSTSTSSSVAAHHLSRPTNSLTPPGCSPSTSIAPVARPISPAPSVTSDMNSAQIIETIKLVLRVSGYGEDAVSEISSGMSTLANYGVLGVGLGLL